MAVLGIALVTDVYYDTTTTFGASIKYAGIGAIAEGSINLTGISPTITSGLFQAAIANGVKSALISSFGYSFGLFDTVNVIGATL